MMAIEVPEDEKVFTCGEYGRRERVGPRVLGRRTDGRSINIKKRERCRVETGDGDSHIISAGVQRRERICRELRCRETLSDKGNNPTTDMGVIVCRVVRPGARAVRSKGCVSRNLKGGGRV